MKCLFLGLLMLLSAGYAQSASLTTPAANQLDWQLPSGWLASAETPDELLAEIALHIGHEATEKGKTPTQQQLLQAAAKRMEANELLLYHPKSGAWISIDFSPLRTKEKSPTTKTLELSARYALESLGNEEGISEMQKDQQVLNLAGAPDTNRITANYKQHDSPTAFSGLIGYIPGEWFFIYATSYPEKAELSAQISTFFESLIFTPKTNP